MTRWKFTIEYKGTDYAGWQRQASAPSIQQAIEEAIKAFCGQEIPLTAAGRTDAGVHALGQVAHADLELKKDMSGFEISKAINAHLKPRPISVIAAEVVPPDFHARFAAKNKLYRYRIVNRSAFLTADAGLAWHFKRKLDPAAMHEVAQMLVGKHDFTTFRATDCQAKSPVKTLNRLDVTTRDYDAAGGCEIIIEAESLSFLHHQVRNIVGSLTLIGEGKWTKADLQSALDAKDRAKGGPTAAPEGLYLVRVDY